MKYEMEPNKKIEVNDEEENKNKNKHTQEDSKAKKAIIHKKDYMAGKKVKLNNQSPQDETHGELEEVRSESEEVEKDEEGIMRDPQQAVET